MNTLSYLWQYLAKFFLDWEIFQTKVVEKIKTHILSSITLLGESFHWWDHAENCGWARETAKNMAHACCMLDKYGCTGASTPPRPCTPPPPPHKHKEICTISCFSTSTMVTRTRLTITLYVHCLSCSQLFYIYLDNVVFFNCMRVRTYRHKCQVTTPYQHEAPWCSIRQRTGNVTLFLVPALYWRN